MRNLKYLFILLAGSFLTLIHGCRKDEDINPSTPTEVDDGKEVEEGDIVGFFLLNEGNMGSNKASIDYFDYETGIYHRNIYAERNPGVVKELGDVGNDLQIYRDKLYAVINCSNLVEVMNVETLQHITQISIPNCRYIAFKDDHAYVTSYAGEVGLDPNARLGYVARIDLNTMTVKDTCVVGYQPEELVVAGDKLYVANSGGYRFPDYDNTVSVIDLNTFEEKKKIEVAVNLHRLQLDNYGNLWVSSRGDYYGSESKTFVIDTNTDAVTDTLHLVPNENMTLCGDSLYIYSAEWNWYLGINTISYAIINTSTKKVVTRSFIKDGTESEIVLPYGIAVNPESGEFFVTDATDYVTPGRLHCYGRDGIRKWSVTTGDIPAHFAFTRTKLKPLDE
ncbi:MAG: YncE family protein [Rikenellaceae bacterium]|nr:YncE family protein [Rikenellaceae bacterium]